MKLAKNIFSFAKKRNKKRELREYQIGPYVLSLPKIHKLDSFQKKFPRYDFALGEIARIIHQYYPNFTAIDVGANIGDSAALICKHQKVPVLCIEGAPQYIEILNNNVQRISSEISIKECFLGTGEESIPEDCKIKHGSFSLITNPASVIKTEQKTLTLKEVIRQFPQFAHSKLIKIDTDGFDFKILKHSIEEIKRMKPVLFYEYDICFTKEDCRDAEIVMRCLKEINYQYFIVYDNFGNFLCALDEIEKFDELNIYLLSNKYHSSIVSYFDICAIPKEMHKIYESIRQHEMSFKNHFLENIKYPQDLF